MPSKAGSRPPKYRLHKATGQAMITIKGKDFYLGKYGTEKSKQEYARRIAEMGFVGAEPSNPGRSLTVTQLCLLYRDYADGYYAKAENGGGEFVVIDAMLSQVAKLYGDVPADKFGPLALKAVQKSFLGRKVHDKPISRSYINKLTFRAKRMYRWAASEELVPVEVMHALLTVPGLRKGKTTARETEPKTPVADAVVEATLPHLRPMMADMVRLQRLTGMRPGEVCQLTPSKIDRSRDVWLFIPGKHKTEHLGKVRVIALGPKAQATLGAYLDRPADAYCFSPAADYEQRMAEKRAARKTKVQPSQADRRSRSARKKPGEKYTVAVMRRAIYDACDLAWPPPEHLRKRLADLKPAQRVELRAWRSRVRWSPNQLRHSRGTEVRRDYGLEAAQVVLGHAHMNTTEIYAEKHIQLAMEVAKATG